MSELQAISGDDDKNVATRNHFVYRAFNARGRLLYVGCTHDLTKRWKQHRLENRHWTEQTTRICVQGPYPLSKARAVERAAIKTENPRYNSTPERVARLAAKKAWQQNRLKELLNGQRPKEVPFDYFRALSDVASSEANARFPNVWNSNNHPAFGVPKEFQPYLAFGEEEAS